MLPGVNLIGDCNCVRLEMPRVATARLSARFHFVQSLHNARAQCCQAAGMNKMTWTQFVRNAHRLVFKIR
jgi:hypothetical protein